MVLAVLEVQIFYYLYIYMNVNCMPEMKAQADFHITYILVHIVATTNHFYGGEGGVRVY